MRRLISLTFLLLLATAGSPAQDNGRKINTLTSKEVKQGWKLLFDGKTFSGWRGLGRDHVPEGFWVIEEGMIRKLGNESAAKLHQGIPLEEGDLMTTATYSDFELVFEWKIGKAGNSGIKYNVSEELSQKYGSQYSALGFEYQLLDDSDPSYKDLKPSQYSGSLYDLLPAKNIKLKPVGEFNSSRIVVKGNHGEHWLNGIKVVEYDFGSKELEDAYLHSKFSKIPGFTEKKNAHIVIQNHEDEAWFRNIKIRVL